MRTARVARLLGPRELRFEEQPLADDPLAKGSFSAVTEVTAVSLGTERAAYVGEPPLRPGPVYPRLVGYCNVARVVASETPDVTVGARVYTHQSHRSAFVAAAADVLAVIPPEVTSRDASVVYLAHLGLAALQRAGFTCGDRVAVIGLGAIGLATVALGNALSAAVIAVGNAPEREEVARRLGAHSVARADAVPDASADLVVLTANTWSAFEHATRIAAPHGRIAVLGFPGRTEGPPPFNPLQSRWFYDKQLALYGAGLPVATGPRPADESRVLARGIAALLDMMARGRLDLGPLVTDEVPAAQLREVYERASRSEKSLITAVLDWSAS